MWNLIIIKFMFILVTSFKKIKKIFEIKIDNFKKKDK